MGNVLQCALIAFLAVANVLAGGSKFASILMQIF